MQKLLLLGFLPQVIPLFHLKEVRESIRQDRLGCATITNIPQTLIARKFIYHSYMLMMNQLESLVHPVLTTEPGSTEYLKWCCHFPWAVGERIWESL